MMEVLSSGVVIFRKSRSDFEFLLVKQRDSKRGYWIFPKGKAEGKEQPKQTAIREVKEETNLDVSLIDGFEKLITLVTFDDFIKRSVFFLAKTAGKVTLQESDELITYTWASIEKARKLIKHPQVREVLEDAYEFILEKNLN
jgi:8-oxo-dGTP pyrophosphatase MutT (NUDIX family)